MGLKHSARVSYELGRLVGRVVGTKMQKTVKVSIPYFWRHPKYSQFIRRRTRLFAHDEYELCSVGDVVRLKQSRPLSKNKSHVVQAIVRREDGSPPPDPFPNANADSVPLQESVESGEGR